jgi:hypothetical protein
MHQENAGLRPFFPIRFSHVLAIIIQYVLPSLYGAAACIQFLHTCPICRQIHFYIHGALLLSLFAFLLIDSLFFTFVRSLSSLPWLEIALPPTTTMAAPFAPSPCPRNPPWILGQMASRIDLLLPPQTICKYESLCVSYFLCITIYLHLLLQSSLSLSR